MVSFKDPFDNENIIENDYQSLLNAMTRKWYFTQLTHKVSASAADDFWEIAKNFWPRIEGAKQAEAIARKTPLFQNQRKRMSQQLCPDIHMEFGFLNVTTGVIHKISALSTPIKQYERNPEYIKLYEEAHIKVR